MPRSRRWLAQSPRRAHSHLALAIDSGILPVRRVALLLDRPKLLFNKECGLGGVGLGDAAQPDLIVGSCRQHDVVRLNSCELFEYRAWEVAKPGALLPHLQALPQHESEEAHEDVGLDALRALVPDRAYVHLIFLDPKSRFGLGELDVALPQLFIVPIGDVRAQEIGAL